MNKLDRLPQNQLVARINHLKKEFRAVKNKQIIGTKSQRPQRYFTDKVWDVHIHADSFSTTQFRLSFIPDNAIRFQGLVYTIMYTVTPGPENQFFEVSYQRDKPNGSIQYWLFTSLSDPGDLYLKFYMAGASTGTLDAQAV